MSIVSNQIPSSPSPELALAVPAKLEEVCKVDDFINVYKLQAVMNTLVRKIDAQQAHIEKLETEIRKNNISREYFDQYSAGIEKRLNSIETTMAKWSHAWNTIETAAEHMESYHTRMNELITNLSQKVDIADFAQLKYDIAEAFDLHRQEIDTSKASSDSMNNLETSQRRILEEIVALQQLIACKVDKVEVPLLNIAGEKLKKLVEFSEQCGPRLAQLEDAIITTSKVVSGKVDKGNIEERLDLLQEQLRERPEFTWLSKKVLDPLDAIQRDIGSVMQTNENMQKALEQVDDLTHKYAQVQQTYQASLHANGDIKTKLQELSRELQTKPNMHMIDERLVERDQLIEEVLVKHSHQIAADAKLQSAFVNDLHAKISNILQAQTAQEKQMSVVMKFVDWFTEMKLKSS